MRQRALASNLRILKGFSGGLAVAAGLLLAGPGAGSVAWAQTADPNFHIYLAFGQSNMEGNGQPDASDKTGVNERFRMMAAVDFSNPARQKGQWYTAVPPLCRQGTGLNPADYFGRTLVDSLPTNIKVGVINVSVAGCAIEMFDKDKYASYVAGEADWMKTIANQYGGNPYGRLVEVAKLAQKDGVIKGFLLHQGESGSKTGQWANEVKIIYNHLIQDLGLDASKTPLLAGDLVTSSTMIKNLPQTLPNSYVISSQGLTAKSDRLHFDNPGYREFGKRYASTMLSILAKQPATGLVERRGKAGYGISSEPLYQVPGLASFAFEIPKASFVSVKAYTLQGEAIAELAAKEFAAGKHLVSFNGQDGRQGMPKGAFILVLQTPELTFSRQVNAAK
jgi:Carbohydrate esterase, sialic acid-specific acetylesterase